MSETGETEFAIKNTETSDKSKSAGFKIAEIPPKIPIRMMAGAGADNKGTGTNIGNNKTELPFMDADAFISQHLGEVQRLVSDYHEFRVNWYNLIHWINEKVSLLKGFVL